eukprot:PhF_6_TR5515/c0_g1_i1/m.7823
MLRRNLASFAVAFPREAWDPAHHSPKWVDSYAEPIAIRRDWPVRKWLVGLEPKSPREYLGHSLRNLAYEYNARMRACRTFPDVVPLYKEMLTRGVKIDVDTMYIILSRAARFEGVSVQQLFMLYDEMVQAGARPDIGTTEILHTIWDMTPPDPSNPEHEAFREFRRRQLGDTYNALCKQEITRLGTKGLNNLMEQTFQRFRDNLRSLGLTVSFENYSILASYANLTSLPRNQMMSALKLETSSQEPDFRAFETFSLSAAPLNSLEGILIAMCCDVATVLFPNEVVDHVKGSSGIPQVFFNIKPHLLKEVESAKQDPSLGTPLLDGVSNVLSACVQQLIAKHGTNNNSVVITYTLSRMLYMFVAVDKPVPLKASVLEDMLELCKFYGLSNPSRRLLQCAWNSPKVCSLSMVASFIAAVDPWVDRGFKLNAPAPGRIEYFFSDSKKKSSTQDKGKQWETPQAERTGTTLKAKFTEIMEFGYKAAPSIIKSSTSEQKADVLVSLLWFLRRGILGATTTADNALQNLQIYAMATEILQSIEKERLALCTTYEKALKSYCWGEYVDHILDLISTLMLKSTQNQDTWGALVEMRKNVLEFMQADPNLLLAWAEEM